MKKTIPTTLSGILFYIEENAYARLSSYLDSIKLHFSSYPDNAEIITDIENRIAEHFLENKNKNNVVTLENVESLIKSMGNVKDFNEEEIPPTKSSRDQIENGSKKLFRNPDDVMIAGVASGLAAYFGIDSSIMRIIFVLTIFFGGFGILIYIILWLIVPEAKTSTEKLQMRGEPVTIESVNELLKEKVNEVKKNKGTFQKIISLPFVIGGKIIKTIVPVIGKLIGLFIALSFGICAFSILFGFIVVLFNMGSPYIDFPLMEIGGQFIIYTGMFATFFVVFIPCVLFLLLGIKILNRKRIFHPALVSPLLIIWSISIITIGVIGTKVVPKYQDMIENNPKYQETTMDFPLTDFTGVSIQNGNKVTITEGEAFKVSANGRIQNIENLTFSIKDDVLVIDKKEDQKICIFCFAGDPHIIITMPEIKSIYGTNSANITTSKITTDDFTLKLDNYSKIEMTLDVKNLNIEQEDSARSHISGKAENGNFYLSNYSRMEAPNLTLNKATINAQDVSKAEVKVNKKLNVNLENYSTVIYNGKPQIEKEIDDTSKLEKVVF